MADDMSGILEDQIPATLYIGAKIDTDKTPKTKTGALKCMPDLSKHYNLYVTPPSEVACSLLVCRLYIS